jgi:hypothetical protein
VGPGRVKLKRVKLKRVKLKRVKLKTMKLVFTASPLKLVGS